MKRILKLLIISIITLASCVQNSNEKIAEVTSSEAAQNYNFEDAKKAYHKTAELREKYLGFSYENPQSIEFIKTNGSPETLQGTNNNKWIVYFAEGNLTAVIDKKTSKFENICFGKNPNLINDVTATLTKFIGKRMEYYTFIEIINSIKYGSSEKLGLQNCVNKDCVEYYSKGDFTTVAFMEFSNEGDFVTLKKISSGKVPRLNEY